MDCTSSLMHIVDSTSCITRSLSCNQPHRTSLWKPHCVTYLYVYLIVLSLSTQRVNAPQCVTSHRSCTSTCSLEGVALWSSPGHPIRINVVKPSGPSEYPRPAIDSIPGIIDKLHEREIWNNKESVGVPAISFL